jgi:hypothetical protein
MKELIGISAISILFGIADARAEEQITGNNIVQVAQKSAQNYSRQHYRRLGYHRSRRHRERAWPLSPRLGTVWPHRPHTRTITED